MSDAARITLHALPGIPAVGAGDDLAALIAEAAARLDLALHDGVLVVCQKVVSKAEGRVVALADVAPSDEARRIATEDDKDPRMVELALREARRIVRRGHGVLITETHHGFVCANSGIDQSNTAGADQAILLPEDPDASAAALHAGLATLGAHHHAVVVSDTFGRPWREGLVDLALGCHGLAPLEDLRGQQDWSGRELAVTTNHTPDQLAAAAGLLMQKAKGLPAIWIEGLQPTGQGTLASTLRNPETDLFR